MTGKMKATITQGIVNLKYNRVKWEQSDAKCRQSLAHKVAHTHGLFTNKSKQTNKQTKRHTQTQMLKQLPLRNSITGVFTP